MGNKGNPRNYALASGVMRFSKSSMYHKKAIYKFVKQKTAKKTTVKPAIFVEKKIGGAKNGGTRMVRVKKLKNDYPTALKPVQKKHQSCFKHHTRRRRYRTRWRAQGQTRGSSEISGLWSTAH